LREFKRRECRECGETYQPKGVRSAWCPPCLNTRTKQRDKERRHGRTVQTKGLTVDQYAAMLDSQNGTCAICKEPPGYRRLAIDHDHSCCPGERSCGKCVRSLLCDVCNTRLGVVEIYGDQMREYLARYYDKAAEDGFPF
jgi:hypothetical protein